MITELSAHNFKSWQATDKIRLAPLTGFFGANSSGKSSILQILLLLKQTTERPIGWKDSLYYGDEESLVNLNSFDNIIHQPTDNPNLEIFVSWKLTEKLKFQNVVGVDTFSYLLSIRGGAVDAFRYVAGEHFLDIHRNLLTDSTSGSRYSVSIPDGDYGAESLVRCYGISGTPMQVEVLAMGFEEAFETLFSRIYYLGPLREYPRHRYTWQGDHPKDIAQDGERTISALLSGRIRDLPTDEQIPKWLKQLELIDSYRLHPFSNTGGDYEFLVKQYKGGPEVPLTDVGFGVSQVLPVLTLCYYVSEGSILILEQPEAHLHPKAQSELADVFIDVVKNRNIQIILESHSEHLLLRLMRRIAEYGIEEEGIPADQTAFHFCEINDGISQAEQLKVDEYGNISNWPQNFFGDDMGDVAKKTKAEMKRRKEKKK